PIETAPCYCGQKGCLERICSTDFLHRNGAAKGKTLSEIVATSSRSAPVERMLKLVGMGIANAVNFVRPHRLVLVSDLVRYEAFNSELQRHIRAMLLTELA